MDRFLTKSSDALGSVSAEDRVKNELRVDFFLSVLGTFNVSLKSRFNFECTSVLKLTSFLFTSVSFDDAVRQLAATEQLNTDLCVAEGRVAMTNKC